MADAVLGRLEAGMTVATKTRVAFYTFGCRLNQAETSALEHTFDGDDYVIVDWKQGADIVVINTCTVTENGDADTRRMVNRVNRRNPDVKIALIGCQAQIQKERLAGLPNVHWIVGNAKKMDLKAIIRELADPPEPRVIVPAIPRDHFTMPTAVFDRNHTRANLKIQDGCDFFCSFCEIPFARGRARSRAFNDLIREAKHLVANGHREIILTGINLGTYAYLDKSVNDVINALEALDGLERIRISSIEPTTIPDGLIDRMAQNSKLCRYLHIPLQSGSDDILQAMQRRYRVHEFRDFIMDVHRRVPDVCIGTDIIAGFPGETDFFFAQTYELVKNLPFAYFHVFSYSERQWAKSRTFSDPVDAAVIQQRSKLLRDLSYRKRQSFLKNQIGKNYSVLFEQQKNGMWEGLTDNYIRVKVSSAHSLKNSLHPVRITDIDGPYAVGRIV